MRSGPISASLPAFGIETDAGAAGAFAAFLIVGAFVDAGGESAAATASVSGSTI